MRWRDIGTQTCSVARALSVVGERWTLLVLREAFLGRRRFEDFHAGTGATRPIVADRLARLVDDGVLERRPYQEHPPRDEYRLTEKGRDLHPVIVGLLRWGDRWMDDGGGPPIELVHEGCGHRTNPFLSCSECGEPIDARSVRLRPGPSLRRGAAR